jgi:hypothetical protein
MSVKMMGAAWELDLKHNELLVLLALADHADHEGNNAYPSVGLLAWKTGYNAATVHRCLRKLELRKIISGKKRQGQTTIYSIHPDKGKPKPPRETETSRKLQEPMPNPDDKMPEEVSQNASQTSCNLPPKPSIEPSDKPPEKKKNRLSSSSNVNKAIEPPGDRAGERDLGDLEPVLKVFKDLKHGEWPK